jgi:hypothetical protein
VRTPRAAAQLGESGGPDCVVVPPEQKFCEIPGDPETPVRVRNLRGSLVYEKTPSQYPFTFEGNGLASGSYVLSFTVNGKEQTRKLVIVH